MKNFVAIFWRGNPQLANGGYEKKKDFEARTFKAAERKMQKWLKDTQKHTVYGTFSFMRWEESYEA